MEALARKAGGIELIYRRIQGKEKRRLRTLYPLQKACWICHGDGKLFEAEECTKCNGSGITKTNPCPNCTNSGSVPCWRCNGDGEIRDLITPKTCYNCQGTGKGWLARKCLICGGDGKIFDGFPAKTCPKCLGTKELQCWQCGGKGEIKKLCPQCGGDGKTHDFIEEQECWNCKGKGSTLV